MPNSLTPDWTGDLSSYAPGLAPDRAAGQRPTAASQPEVRARPRAAAPRRTARQPASRRFGAYARRPLRHMPSLLFVAGLLALCYAGWRSNEEGHLTPETGLGYWLGIVGSSAMAALLLYPLRKRLGQARWLGSVPAWFRVHMMLGLLGPALILVHANFRSQSLNATVALVAMLLVAGSGLVGRYLYGRVHMGLYGRKARLDEILADRDALNAALGDELPAADHIVADLEAHSRRAMTSSTLVRLVLLPGRTRRLRRRLERTARRAIAEQATANSWSRAERRRRLRLVREHLLLSLRACDKAATFGIYDRLLSAWHVAHLPMFLLLVLAAIVHIVAVHLY